MIRSIGRTEITARTSSDLLYAISMMIVSLTVHAPVICSVCSIASAYNGKMMEIQGEMELVNAFFQEA